MLLTIFRITIWITEFDGKNVYINKVAIEPKKAENILFEVHKKYIDIQIDLEGNEILQTTNKNLKNEHDFDEAGDYALYSSDVIQTECFLEPKECVVYFPDEIHKPGVKNSSEKITKCIVKVLDDWR